MCRRIRQCFDIKGQIVTLRPDSRYLVPYFLSETPSKSFVFLCQHTHFFFLGLQGELQSAPVPGRRVSLEGSHFRLLLPRETSPASDELERWSASQELVPERGDDGILLLSRQAGQATRMFARPTPVNSCDGVQQSRYSLGDGWSEFPIPTAAFQEPSACFFQMSTNLPLLLTVFPSASFKLYS